MLYRAEQSFHQIVDFILPPHCVSCNKLGQLFCAECQAKIVWMEPPLCSSCGRENVTRNRLCSICKSHQHSSLHFIRATTLFAPPITEIVHHLKYYNSFALARPLAELMARAWATWIPENTIDLIIPVPLHPEREQTRGYNQSALLAYHLSHMVRRPYDESVLQRIRQTQPQARLNATERKTNVLGAFEFNRGDIAHKHILLIDDVCTTGATLEAAATSLLHAGAKRVSAYCLARAV